MPKRANGRKQCGPYWLSKRPNSDQWCRTWYEGRQTRRASLGTSHEDEAWKRLTEWYVARRTMRNERPAEVGLADIMARHYALHGQKLRSGNAVKTSCDYWAAYFAGATVADVTPARIADFVDRLREMGKSNGYIRRILADGKAALNRALARGEITSAPHVDLSLAPEGEPRQRILSIKEMAALYEAIEAPHAKTYVLLALGTMARPEAITDLTSFAIDWESGSINLLPAGGVQTKKHRAIVPMTPTIRRLCARLPGGPLVAFQGRAVSTIRTTFRKAIDAAGLAGTNVCLYSLRHTIISEAMKRCPEPWQVETFAGHRTGSKTTARYVKFSPGYLSKAAEAIEDYFADLEAMLGRSLLDHVSTSAFELRASPNWKLVEPRGIEPLTSTMPL